MACTFVVNPVVFGAWPRISAAAERAASQLGFRRVSSDSGRGSELVFDDGEVTLTVASDVLEKVTVNVAGALGDEELRRAGEAFMGRLSQEYAASQVVEQLEPLGYRVVGQAVEPDRTLRVDLRPKS